jgi:glycosyltransferase involved in cell wall biosynthesis
MKPKILFIEICNYKDYPIGGYLAFAKQMITAFGDNLALVGLSTDETPIGVWTKKEIDGVNFDFFSVKRVSFSHKKSLIPGRLISYMAVRKYRKDIFRPKFENVFVQTPEVLFALSKTPIRNLCTRIPGVENPMSISRYWYGKYFSSLFDRFYFKALKKSRVILASADSNAIREFIVRGKKVLPPERVIQFPTRVNTKIFKPTDQVSSRKLLGLNEFSKIVVTSGRISKLKGWEFMLQSYIKFKLVYPDSLFIFLGDGEDRDKIEAFVTEHALAESVLLPGRINHIELANYLNAADLFVMGSFVEGWSTSLVEAMACAKPVVCTSFSSASELIQENENGFIIHTRDEDLFSTAMVRAINIPYQNLVSRAAEMEIYSSSKLREDILLHWKLV